MESLRGGSSEVARRCRRVVLLVLAGLAASTGSASVAGAVGRAGHEADGAFARCARLLSYEASDPLHTVGDRALDAHSRRYEPVGISVYGGLEQWNGLDPGVEQRVSAQITAATRFWHANTVRLQVAEALYFADPAPFLQELDREVLQISCAGAIAVINDNTLFTTNPPGPTAETAQFLKVLARRYRGFNNVIFDLFNEPRLPRRSRRRSVNQRWVWRFWQRGGTVGGVRYVGMQDLVDAVRSAGAHNLLWVEGPRRASTLALINRYPIRGENIELAFHHPRLNRPSTWPKLLRATSARPEVEGEEAQYSSATRPECRRSAYLEVPKLLRLLAADGDGLVAWTLQPGVLVASRRAAPVTDVIVPADPSSPEALKTPNKLKRDYRCTSTPPSQGMGLLAMRFFRRYAAATNPYG